MDAGGLRPIRGGRQRAPELWCPPVHGWRLALQAEAALGLRDAVTARYQRRAELLDDRLGLRPEAATTALYRELFAT